MQRFLAHLLTGFAAIAVFSSTGSASSLTPEMQTAILAKTAAEGHYAKHWNWLYEPSGKLRDDVVFAVTDFDRDGKLELFGLRPRREQEGPQIVFQELLNEAGQFGSGRFMAGHSYLPDLLTGDAFGQAAVRVDEGADRYRYLMEEITLLAEDGDFRKTKTTFFSIGVSGSELLVEELWSILQEADGAGSSKRYYLPAWLGVEAESDQPIGAPEEVDLDRILAYKEERCPGDDGAMVSFGWRTGAALEKARKEGRLAEELLNSYRVFEASWDI